MVHKIKTVKVEFVSPIGHPQLILGKTIIKARTNTEFKRKLVEARKKLGLKQNVVPTSENWKGFENCT